MIPIVPQRQKTGTYSGIALLVGIVIIGYVVVLPTLLSQIEVPKAPIDSFNYAWEIIFVVFLVLGIPFILLGFAALLQKVMPTKPDGILDLRYVSESVWGSMSRMEFRNNGQAFRELGAFQARRFGQFWKRVEGEPS